MIRLELSNYFYTELNLNDQELVSKVNEYYSLANNLQGYCFISKNKLRVVKNKLDYTELPCRIGDSNFKVLSGIKYEKFIIYELFINKNVQNQCEIENIFQILKTFWNILKNDLKNEKSDKTLSIEFLIQNARRQTRLDIKKYFSKLNCKPLSIFFDNLIYYIADHKQFVDVTEGLINHLKHFYIEE